MERAVGEIGSMELKPIRGTFASPNRACVTQRSTRGSDTDYGSTQQ
jgi:hypothetical protein